MFGWNELVSINLEAYLNEVNHTVEVLSHLEKLPREHVDIDSEKSIVPAKDVTIMPADIPQSVKAGQRFKMLLTAVKKPKDQ